MALSVKAKQGLLAAAMLALAGIYAAGAAGISSEAGYSGVGPNFLPWVVTFALAALGAVLGWQAIGGGWPNMPEADEGQATDWAAFAWVSAGLIANSALITTVGFILSCALCFALAAQGFRRSNAEPGAVRAAQIKRLGVDFLIGAAIAAPVFWMFTLGLNVTLPGLTNTGWL